ncbi:peptidase family C78-domain-containing protein [Apiospora kogelbergensis]|uniref:peptidase family C78-domain-containing protein n=1 Tax=Apiospora kogelbergensis TaxID=1337665 RepID=UPI00312EABD5
MADTLKCPFLCGYHTPDEYDIYLHLETQHSEGTSPFTVDNGHDHQAIEHDGVDGAASSPVEHSVEEEQFAECPIEGCGEVITLAEYDDHIELHNLEEAAGDSSRSASRSPYQHSGNREGYKSPYLDQETTIPAPTSATRRHHGDGSSRQRSSSTQQWKQILHMPSAATGHKRRSTELEPAEERPRKRLGKAELGKYAHEDKMPDWLVALLKKEGQVVETGVIGVLEQLLEQNPTTKYAYLCHPCVQHVSKLKKEGGFCGYRNIQMMSSYIIGAKPQGAEHFRGRLPSIFKIQDWIEHAWDLGINAQGRIETGGVKGTRKYIGTPEAQAMFLSLDLAVEAQGFKDQQPIVAERKLLDHVQAYFESQDFDPARKVRTTSLPPIYFQHRGHSLTIVGLEKRSNGSVELLVFDPMFRDPQSITKLVGRALSHKTSPDKSLSLYRRGNKYLKKYHEFELLQ